MATKTGEKTGGRKKGSLNQRTILKKSIGLKNWKDLAGWIEGPGIRKYISEMNGLKGAAFTVAFHGIVEYVKPKLQRTEHQGEIRNINYNVELSKQEILEIDKALEDEC